MIVCNWGLVPTPTVHLPDMWDSQHILVEQGNHWHNPDGLRTKETMVCRSTKLLLIGGVAFVAFAIALSLGLYFPLSSRGERSSAAKEPSTETPTLIPAPSPTTLAPSVPPPPVTARPSLRMTNGTESPQANGFGVVAVTTTTTPTNSPVALPNAATISPTPGALLFTDPPTSFPVASIPSPTDPPEALCNGLANLCDKSVDSILYATVHNANSALEDGIASFYNHERNFLAALEAGYRGINFDIGICDDELRLVHSICFLGHTSLPDALNGIVDFLEANPQEVILMPTQLTYSTGGTFSVGQDLYPFLPVRFVQQLYKDFDGTTWPTLAELIQRNQRILFFHYNGDSCDQETCPGMYSWFDFAAESKFEFATAEEALEPTACETTRGSNGRGDWYGVNLFTQLPVCATETTNPLTEYDTLRTHIGQCESLTNRDVNLVIVDCWDQGDVVQVVQEYNSAL